MKINEVAVGLTYEIWGEGLMARRMDCLRYSSPRPVKLIMARELARDESPAPSDTGQYARCLIWAVGSTPEEHGDVEEGYVLSRWLSLVHGGYSSMKDEGQWDTWIYLHHMVGDCIPEARIAADNRADSILLDIEDAKRLVRVLETAMHGRRATRGVLVPGSDGVVRRRIGLGSRPVLKPFYLREVRALLTMRDSSPLLAFLDRWDRGLIRRRPDGSDEWEECT